jgi:hypothetical protein
VNDRVYAEYRPSHRRFGRHDIKTGLLGAVPAATAALLIASKGSAAGPGLWSALGVSLATQLVLWSARELLRTHEPKTAAGDRLVRRADEWYPSFLIAIQGIFVAVTVMLLWLTICDLGFRASAIQHIAIAALLAVVPAGRMLKATRPEEPSPARQNVEEFLRLALIWIVCILAASGVTLAQGPTRTDASPYVPVAIIAAWLPAALIMLTSLVLFLEHASARRPARPEEALRDRLE